MTKFEKRWGSSYLPAYEDGTVCSETSTYKIPTPGNYPEESIQNKYHPPRGLLVLFVLISASSLQDAREKLMFCSESVCDRWTIYSCTPCHAQTSAKYVTCSLVRHLQDSFGCHWQNIRNFCLLSLLQPEAKSISLHNTVKFNRTASCNLKRLHRIH